MNILKLYEIDRKIKRFEMSLPLELYGMLFTDRIDFNVSPWILEEENLIICHNYLEEIKSYLQTESPNKRILNGIRDLKELVLFRSTQIYKAFSYWVEDFYCFEESSLLEDQGRVFKDEETGLPFDKNTGLPIDPDLIIKEDAYINAVTVFKRLYALLIDSLDLIIEDYQYRVERLIPEPVPTQETPSIQLQGDQESEQNNGTANFKILLFHELGLLMPLKERFDKNNIGPCNDTTFAKLISELLGCTQSLKTVERIIRAIEKNEMTAYFSPTVIMKARNKAEEYSLNLAKQR